MMGNSAVYAALYTFFRIMEMSSALISIGIQRTIAEHAVEAVRVLCFVTREVLAFFVAKKLRTVLHMRSP